MKRDEIERCGNCGHSERAHQHATGTDPEAIGVLAALGGPCLHFTASDASVVYQRHLAITNHRDPKHGPGRVGERKTLCGRCGNRGHDAENCPF